MKHLLNKILISIIVLGGILLFGTNVFAGVPVDPPDPLIVQFEKSPLFSETNILPGDTVNRWIKVWNNSGEVQKIVVSPINVNNPDGLGDVLYLQIKEGVNALYNGTLAGFFSAGTVYLSDLANGGQTQYDFYVTFDSASGEEYAGKILGFDFQIGFQGGSLGLMAIPAGVGGDGGGDDSGGSSGLLTGNGSTGGNYGGEQGIGVEESGDGQVLGEATFRTYLPNTGGIMSWLLKDEGSIYSNSQKMQTNILIAGIFVLVMIGLVVIRKIVSR
jgi:hypothetical protein